jgi:uncharacterized membrane protein (UPF0136 family)
MARREERSYFGTRGQPTWAWYLVSILLGVVGGIIGYFAVKDRDQDMANKLLIVGIVVTIIAYLFLGGGIIATLSGIRGPYFGAR